MLMPSAELLQNTIRLPLVVLKGTAFTTAFWAVTFVSDRDFSLRKTSHIINAIPPPGAAPAEVV